MCPRLQLPHLLKLLEHFEPDEYSCERVPVSLLAALHASAAAARIAAAAAAPTSPGSATDSPTALLRAPRAAWMVPSLTDVALHAGLLPEEPNSSGGGDDEAVAGWRAAWGHMDQVLVERSVAAAERPLLTLAAALDRALDATPARRFDLLRDFWST